MTSGAHLGREIFLQTNKNSYCSSKSTVISCCFQKRFKSSLEFQFHNVKLVPAERMYSPAMPLEKRLAAKHAFYSFLN
jgi:hypothetical protein